MFVLGTLLAVNTARADDLTLDLGNNVTMKLVQIPEGKFLMGSPETEKDRDKSESLNEVTISKPFYMGKYEVTQAQWMAVMGSNPSRSKSGADHPVESVTWDECQKFCQKLSDKAGKTVRLPTEAEWEYACRAGGQKRYGAGDSDDAFAWYAWYGDDSGHHPVGQKKPNAWGLYDTHGNVSEWCQDWYTATPKIGAETDPTGPSQGTLRVTRGGSSVHFQGNCRAASRSKNNPASRSGLIGLRVVVETPRVSQPLAAKKQTETTKSTDTVKATTKPPATPEDNMVLPADLLKQFAWFDTAYFREYRPTRIGVLVLIYERFAEKDGNKVFLDPKTSATTAQKSPQDYLAYEPLINDAVTQAVGNEIQNRIQKLLTKHGIAGDVLIERKKESIRSSLHQLPQADAYLVVALGDIAATLITMNNGDRMASVNTDRNIVLLNHDLKPVAGLSNMSISQLKTIGPLETEYDKANSFSEKVSFRYTMKAFTEVACANAEECISVPFLESIARLESKGEAGMVSKNKDSRDDASSSTSKPISNTQTTNDLIGVWIPVSADDDVRWVFKSDNTVTIFGPNEPEGHRDCSLQYNNIVLKDSSFPIYRVTRNGNEMRAKSFAGDIINLVRGNDTPLLQLKGKWQDNEAQYALEIGGERPISSSQYHVRFGTSEEESGGIKRTPNGFSLTYKSRDWNLTTTADADTITLETTGSSPRIKVSLRRSGHPSQAPSKLSSLESPQPEKKQTTRPVNEKPEVTPIWAQVILSLVDDNVSTKASQLVKMEQQMGWRKNDDIELVNIGAMSEKKTPIAGILAKHGKPDRISTSIEEVTVTEGKKEKQVFDCYTYGIVEVRARKETGIVEWMAAPVSMFSTGIRTAATQAIEARTLSQPGGKQRGLPLFRNELQGANTVRVKNPNNFAVKVGLRSGQDGKDFEVSAHGSSSISVPDGYFDIYFQYSTDPDGLYQGDSFTLAGNGVEIQIVKVVNGNYGIRKVK